MALPKAAGLVTSPQEERWVYYRLAEPEPGSLAEQVLVWLQEHRGQDAIL